MKGWACHQEGTTRTEMGHDSELRFEQVVRPNRVDQHRPIAEFLAKKAEPANSTFRQVG